MTISRKEIQMVQAVIKHNLILLLLITLGLSSCGESGVIINQSKPVKSAVWESNDSLVFNFNIEDTTNYFDFSILIRNTENYQWSNIYLFSDLTFPNGKKRTDTIEVLLADQYGYWLGNNSGTFITTAAKFMNHRRFPLTGDYKLAITHGMREKTLTEVSDVGIKIKNWKEK